MSSRYDPRERWRWEEEQRDREERESIEREGRFARDAGDPRWGTGGMPVDARTYRALRGPGGRGWSRGRIDREGLVREAPGDAEWESIAQGPYVGRGPRGYRRTDERIREDVCERFTRHGHLDPSGVEVAVHSGEVMLTGAVATRAQKRLAEDVADAVFGVIEVHNHLHVMRIDERTTPSPEASASPRGAQPADGRRADEFIGDGR